MPIVLTSGLQVTNTEPVDSRFVTSSSANRNGISAANVYEGLVVYLTDTKKYTLLVSSSNPLTDACWVELNQSSGSQYISGSLTVTQGVTASLYGTASWASNAPIPNRIVSGSIVASVDVSPNDLFLIKSGSNTYFNISSSSNTELYSDLFIVKNFTTKQPILTISQSIIQFVTQSSDPTGTAHGGSFWFTSTDLYVALD